MSALPKAAAAAGAATAGAVVLRRRLRTNAHGAGHTEAAEGPTARDALTILAPVDQVQEAWRRHWDAEIDDVADDRIAWHAPDRYGGGAGETRFAPAPGDKGTELRVEVQLDRSAVAGVAERLAGEAPQQQLRMDLRKFKSVVEAGEAVEIAGQPTGRGPVARRLQEHAAKLARTGGRA